MATGVLLTPPIVSFSGNNGLPAVNGSVLTQVGGANAATYQDSGLTTPLPNPIPLNSRGEVSTSNGVSSQCFLTPNVVYTFTLFDGPNGTGNQIWSATYVNGVQFVSQTAAQIGLILNPRTPAEIAAGITPVNYVYPEGIVDRYLTNTTPGTTDMNAGFVACFAVAFNGGGKVQMLDEVYATTALTFTFTGTRATNGIRWFGVAPNNTKINLLGTPTAGLLNILSSSLTTINPTEVNLQFADFTINDPVNGKTCDGIVLNNVANVVFSNVIIRGFAANLHNKSSLDITLVNGCQLTDGNYGLLCEANGTGGSYCNLITAYSCKFNINSTWGVYYDYGDQIHLRSCDLESNGTSANVNTGAVRIRPTVGPGALLAGIVLDRCWIEQNKGVGIQIDAPAGGCATTIAISGGNLLSQEAGRAIICAGCTNLSIRDLKSATPGDTWNLTASAATLENVTCYTLTDGGISRPTYVNVTTSAGNFSWGRPDTQTLTLTGVSGTVTSAVTLRQQGDEIELDFVDFLGTSTTTAATITGLASKYAPTTNAIFMPVITEDSGLDAMSYTAMAIGGTMTLYKAGSPNGFTASGFKGIRAQQLRYRLN